MPKGCQNGTNIDAETHQQSMPKLVTEKSLKLSKNMFFWMVKSFEIIVKTMVFAGFTSCVRERKRHPKNTKHDIVIHPIINKKSMQNRCWKKWWQNHGTGAEIDPKRKPTLWNKLKNVYRKIMLNNVEPPKRKPAMRDAFGWIPRGGLGPNILIDPRRACRHVKCVRGDGLRFQGFAF